MTQIRNKRQMYQLAEAGKFGNSFHNWNSWKEVQESGYRGILSIRSLKTSDPIAIYDVSPSSLKTLIKAAGHSIDADYFKFYEATPLESRMIQGELTDKAFLRFRPYFHYSTAKDHMRPALEMAGRHASGIEAISILQYYLDETTYDWIFQLLSEYPDSTIEFTYFNMPVGIMQKPYVVWEVRHY